MEGESEEEENWKTRERHGVAGSEREEREEGAMMHKSWVSLTDLILVTPMLLQKSLKTCLDRKCRKYNQRENLDSKQGHLRRQNQHASTRQDI